MSSIASVPSAVASPRSPSTQRGPLVADDAGQQSPFAMLLDATCSEPSPAPLGRGASPLSAPQPRDDAPPCDPSCNEGTPQSGVPYNADGPTNTDDCADADDVADDGNSHGRQSETDNETDNNVAAVLTVPIVAATPAPIALAIPPLLSEDQSSEDAGILPAARITAPARTDAKAPQTEAAIQTAPDTGSIATTSETSKDPTAPEVTADPTSAQPANADTVPVDSTKSAKVPEQAEVTAPDPRSDNTAPTTQNRPADSTSRVGLIKTIAPVDQITPAPAVAQAASAVPKLDVPSPVAIKTAKAKADEADAPIVPAKSQSDAASLDVDNSEIKQAPTNVATHSQDAVKPGTANPESNSAPDQPQHLKAEQRPASETITPDNRLGLATPSSTSGADTLPVFAAQTYQSAPAPTFDAPAPFALASPNAIPLSGLPIEIATQAKDGKNRFEIRLDPPELGRIDVRLDIDSKGNVTSRLMVERQETLDLLRRDAAQLERALQNAGLKTADQALQFSLRDQNSAGRGDNSLSASHLVLSEDDSTPVEILRQGYGRLFGLGGGIDIRV